MRLFAAIVPPPEVHQHLRSAVEPVRDEAIRWASADSWHITLAFYGEVADERVAELTDRLQRVASRHGPVALSIAGVGRFDGRVLWVGCHGDRMVLRRLADGCAAAGRRVGAVADRRRRFRAHLTLARSQRPVDLRPYVEQLAGYAGPEWTATDIALVRSHLRGGEGGRARYETLATLPLAS